LLWVNQTFPCNVFGWHLALGLLCLAIPSVSRVDSGLSCAIHIKKNMVTLYSQVVDPATCKGLLSHYKLANHASYIRHLVQKYFKNFVRFKQMECATGTDAFLSAL
jgi:hypothetical protein